MLNVIITCKRSVKLPASQLVQERVCGLDDNTHKMRFVNFWWGYTKTYNYMERTTTKLLLLLLGGNTTKFFNVIPQSFAQRLPSSCIQAQHFGGHLRVNILVFVGLLA